MKTHSFVNSVQGIDVGPILDVGRFGNKDADRFFFYRCQCFDIAREGIEFQHRLKVLGGDQWLGRQAAVEPDFEMLVWKRVLVKKSVKHFFKRTKGISGY